jgi:hypothetical protein
MAEPTHAHSPAEAAPPASKATRSAHARIPRIRTSRVSVPFARAPHARMPFARRALLGLIACSAMLFAAAPSTDATTHYARLAGRALFGIGDQDPAIFKDPRFIWLGVRSARVIVPWDATRHHGDMERAEWWLDAARAAGVEVLVAFNVSSKHENLLPTMGSYEGAVRAFMHKFPWVNHYQPWNEENELGQPPARNPRRAAEYFNWLSSACHKCAVTAADLLDGPSMVPWLRTFLKYAHKPQLWGLHPYIEMHLGGHQPLYALQGMVHGQIWLTEAGLPLWRYTRANNKFEYTNMKEQELGVRRLLALEHLTGRITRIYYYQWRAPIPLSKSLSQQRHHRRVEATWDSGLLNPSCSTRPTFGLIAKALGRNPKQSPSARLSHNHLECLPVPAKHSK